MICPYCGVDKTSVIDSRVSKDQLAIRRRRQCEGCRRRFTTYERVEVMLPAVVKRDGRREPFQLAKLRAGVELACQKRAVPVDRIDALIAEVERHFAEQAAREVATVDIGETVLRLLRDLDEVAYVRFASVYRVFSDVGQFVTELEKLQGGPR